MLKLNSRKHAPVPLDDLAGHELIICGALRDLVPFVQLKKHEKHPWRSVTFSKVAGLNLQLYQE